MTPTTDKQAAISRVAWQAWIEKGKRQEQARARKFKMVVGVVLALAVLGIVLYLRLNR
jgi:hypothetical protein